MLSKYRQITHNKINLNKEHKKQNKDYEFFLTKIGNELSIYYTFIPRVILMVFGKKDKKYQKISLNLKESINLVKFGYSKGFVNTLFKCMFLDKVKNKIYFKFDLLEQEKTELN